ncbi:MAG: FAD-dependent oxidoreductase, partial [Alphaproteobacteria bacterium]
DVARLHKRCPGIDIHLNTALGRDITLDQLKDRHDAVLLTIGAWWGKDMNIPGEDDARVIDGVEYLRQINAGARPEMPETVVVIGGGDVAMDACRVAKRLPVCKDVKVVYRRSAEEIPARKIELEGAIEEGIDVVYSTRQVSITANNEGLILHCVRTEPGEPDDDGRRRPVDVPGSEHDIACGMVIAAVGQYTACDDLDGRGLMAGDRVRTEFDGMRTDDPKVFAAGDGAFGGSTIVMAMHHGQRAAYYLRAYLEGREEPMAYRTPHRTQRVPVAQDPMWERNPLIHPDFFGLGDKPVEFPEIESTYSWEEARDEAARCYRCDAETGSADYAVRHREDIFTMARTNPADHEAHEKMLGKRMESRDNPFPEGRPATLDDLVFLPANLSRLVIDPYREACKVSLDLGGRMDLTQPFLATGFDDAPDDVRRGVAAGLTAANTGYLGVQPIGDDVPWFQLVVPGQIAPSKDAAAQIHALGHRFVEPDATRLHDGQLLGLALSSPAVLEEAIPFALEGGYDMLLLDGTGALGSPWAELAGPPDLTILRDAVTILRRLRREEEVDLVYFGGVRSGTDGAKIISLGSVASVLGVPLALAVGGSITAAHGMAFTSDLDQQERAQAVANIIKASVNEASMMARCTGKTNLQNLEPEDLRALTLATAEATAIPLAGAT